MLELGISLRTCFRVITTLSLTYIAVNSFNEFYIHLSLLFSTNKRWNSRNYDHESQRKMLVDNLYVMSTAEVTRLRVIMTIIKIFWGKDVKLQTYSYLYVTFFVHIGYTNHILLELKKDIINTSYSSHTFIAHLPCLVFDNYRVIYFYLKYNRKSRKIEEFWHHFKAWACCAVLLNPWRYI